LTAAFKTSALEIFLRPLASASVKWTELCLQTLHHNMDWEDDRFARPRLLNAGIVALILEHLSNSGSVSDVSYVTI
jgi:hypothetical protein